MARKNDYNLSRKKAEELLKDPRCYRVPELDIGRLLKAYQLPNGKILLRILGEGGVLYDSREEVEILIQEGREMKAKYKTSMPEPVTVYFGPYSPESTEWLQSSEDIGRNLSNSLAYDTFASLEPYSAGVDKSFQLDEPARNWLLEFVQYYRQLGFLQEYANLSDADLVEELASLWHEEMASALDLSDPYIDLYLLKWDSERVWWHDIESDVCMGNEMYSAAIENWSDISGDIFLPEEISETWESDTGPVWINFTLNNIHHRIQPRYLDDYIDLDILNQVNQLISETGYRFEACNTGSQEAFVLLLSSELKLRLGRERGWQFTL